MGRLIKTLLVIVAAIVGVFAIAAVALMLFFDPNDFRDRISAAVKASTGRDLVIAGDLSLSVFPWLAVEVGRTQLGNAEGFADEYFLAFEEASLSVRILPLIVSQQVEVGTASLRGLDVNLEVAADGSNNWDDLAGGGETDETGEESSGTPDFDVARIEVLGANISYTDNSTDSSYTISGLSFETGRIAANAPIDLTAEFEFAATPGEMGGQVAMRGTTTLSEGAEQVLFEDLNVSGTLRGVVAEPAGFNFDSRAIKIDTVAQTVDAGELDLSVLGVAMAADVEPFSYAGTPQPVAQLSVATFSLKELMRTLDMEPPATAAADALERVSFSARAAVGEDAVRLTDLSLQLDDSTMTGSLSLPMTETGALGFELAVDSIVVDNYMAPAEEGVAAKEAGAGDMEIPVDLIRTLNANGSFRIGEAWLAGMQLTDLELGLNSSGGKLRLHPLAANFYDGSYSGDIRIDASGDLPTLSVNENINDVNLGAMLQAMYEVEDLTGTINGRFVLAAAGRTLAAMQQDLDGTMSFALQDGAWEGVDVWHQLRTARALYRREPAPEPSLPARTEFSEVSATGVVTDGVFNNEDFLAELPFLQLNGAGMVDLDTTEVNYAMQVRVLDRPEFMAGATEAEIADFTKTVVPLKITGTLSSPSVRPDIEGIFRSQVEEAIEEKKTDLKKRLLDRLVGPEERTSEEAPADGEAPAGDEAPAEEDPVEELKKDLLKKLFER